ncbi:hypothetical protein [Bradyrhizobium sp. USDA 3315]
MAEKKVVSIDELDQFTTDDNGRLYWKGERVLTSTADLVPKLVVVIAALTKLLEELRG